MTRFVRNPAGAVHSVPDDEEFPTGEPNPTGERAPIPGWEDVTEAEASPQLLGEPDPAVDAVRLHTLAENPVDEVASTDPVGVVPENPEVSPVAIAPETSAEVPMTPEEIARVEANAAAPEAAPEPEVAQ
jgi:hypothetical protein